MECIGLGYDNRDFVFVPFQSAVVGVVVTVFSDTGGYRSRMIESVCC